jgi:hypothetical protein
VSKRSTVFLIVAALATLPAATALAQSQPATERVSMDEAGNPVGEGVTATSISPDGRYVVFVTPDGGLYVHDREKGRSAEVARGVDIYTRTAISRGGRYVAYTRGTGPVRLYILDRRTGRTEDALLGTRGRKLRMTYENGFSLTDDGRYVAWHGGARWRAINVGSEGERSGFRHAALYVRDLRRNRTRRASPVFDEFEGDGPVYGRPSLSNGARHLAFTKSYGASVFVRDLRTGDAERVDVSSDGAAARSGQTMTPRISADGRYVAFDSRASNLVPGDANDGFDVFVRDRREGTTKLVSVDAEGIQLVKGGTLAAFSGDGRVALVAADSPFGGTNLYATDVTRPSAAIVNFAADGRILRYERYYDAAVTHDGNTAAFMAPDTSLARRGTQAFVRSPLP